LHEGGIVTDLHSSPADVAVAAPASGSSADPLAALANAASHAPYLGRLMRNHPQTVERVGTEEPAAIVAAATADLAAAADDGADIAAVMSRMRRAKEAAHLAIAAADLSRLWELDTVLEALSRLADAAVGAALKAAIRQLWASGKAGAPCVRDDLPGVFILAMGKMGACELNYSSDVDLIVLYDAEICPIDRSLLKEAMTRLARDLVRVLEERTADGYVFRTDLRLRPDPGSTAPAVSTEFALSYYESVGQNWERMAHIKARYCAGDAQAAAAYLEALQPYVWRRHLDYWAIADIHSIKRQIHAHGRHAPISSADFDVKLGRGGIREIEFFAQVQQLILGGRFPDLRAPATKEALRSFAKAGVVSGATSDLLCRCYDFLRMLEHRIQMVNDEQTHRLPDRDDKRRQIAALAGYGELERFEADIAAVRSAVHGVYSDLFAQEERLSAEGGNLVFTGVDEDPGTLETLSGMGFSDPSRIIRSIQNWHRGGVPATRSARGRQLLTALAPRLLEMISDTGRPDAAFERFADFFASLSAGVQTFSMMLAQPALTRDLIRTMAFAPRLARDLARRPALLEAMLEPAFSIPACDDAPGQRQSRLRARLARAGSFEDELNESRRFHREENFRIGYQLLRGVIRSSQAGSAYADLADACVSVLSEAAAAETLRKHAGSIGTWCVLALGKYGGRELSASSDLDLMVIYEPDEGEIPSLAARFVPRLISALSAPTEEGPLYEVDTQLRPSGRSGPIAVKFSAFGSYYAHDAWTWEYMALTRLRPVAGDEGLARRVMEAARAALAAKSADPGITPDILDMRRRLARERPAKSCWDLKMQPGGLVDIEFILQHAMLHACGAFPDVVRASSREALAALHGCGVISGADAELLLEALELQLNLQQDLRIAAGDAFDPETAGDGLREWLAAHNGAGGFAELEAGLKAVQARIESLRVTKIGPLATE
jgi:glutamate-ammonia-ligase adenylyltransferase